MIKKNYIVFKRKKKYLDCAKFILKKIFQNKHKKIILTGGKSVKKIYKNLFGYLIKVKFKLDIFLSDERCLKFGNKNLNANIFKNKFNNSLVKFHPIIKKKTSFLSAAKVYNKVLPKNPAIILLSVGDDGHIASIFNKSKAIKSNKNFLFMKKKYKKYQRITATLNYLKNKKNIFLLCKGRKRLRIFEKSLRTKNEVLYLLNKINSNIKLILV